MHLLTQRLALRLAVPVLVAMVAAIACIASASSPQISTSNQDDQVAAYARAQRAAERVAKLCTVYETSRPQERRKILQPIEAATSELEVSIGELGDPRFTSELDTARNGTNESGVPTARAVLLLAAHLAQSSELSARERSRGDSKRVAALVIGFGSIAVLAMFLAGIRAYRLVSDVRRVDCALPIGAPGESLGTRAERLSGKVEYAMSQHIHLFGARLDLARALAESEVQERRLEREVLQNRERIEKLEVSQMRDELTGSLNFRYFLLRLNQALDEFIDSAVPFCLIALDLDDFKGINDGYGHHVGDAALREFAALLQRNVRKNDVVFRKSGDEFYVLVPSASSVEGEALGEHLLDLVNGHVVSYESGEERYTVRLGTSVGILHCDQVDPHLLRSLNREQLLSETYGFADAAMFKAKFAGKGCARIYRTGLTVRGVNPDEFPPEFDALNRALRSRYPLLPDEFKRAFNENITDCLRMLNPTQANREVGKTQSRPS